MMRLFLRVLRIYSTFYTMLVHLRNLAKKYITAHWHFPRVDVEPLGCKAILIRHWMVYARWMIRYILPLVIVT